jgi:hypothetical protein
MVFSAALILGCKDVATTMTGIQSLRVMRVAHMEVVCPLSLSTWVFSCLKRDWESSTEVSNFL